MSYLIYSIDPPTTYAGFWKRVGAYVVDSLVLALFFGIGGLFLGYYDVSSADVSSVDVLISLWGFLVPWLYFAVMESSTAQATLGKRAVRLKVVDLEGNRITFGRATGRYFCKFASGLVLGIGYLMVAFTEKRQGMHDYLANTLVLFNAHEYEIQQLLRTHLGERERLLVEQVGQHQ